MNDLKSSHILLIGESPKPEVGLLEILKSQGRPFIYASSGRESIALLLEYDIFLIIIDINFDSSLGIETALLIRSSDRFKQTPILFLFDINPDPEWQWTPLDLSGPVDYMIKPLNRLIMNHKINLFEGITKKKHTDDALKQSKKELEKANEELFRLTEDLEEAISHANKMAVEAEIATITKSGFLASMSHEIRTPLNAVVGFTDLMMDTGLSPEQKEYIDAIRSASNTFLELINDILDFSKIEAEMVSLENIPFSPEIIIDDVLNTLGMRSYEKNIELAYRIDPDVPQQVCGDPVRLKQILVNLVGNAIKFTSQGGIILKVNRESAPGSECCLHFSISDSGIGIPESKWDKLFQPFSQAAHSTTREFGGTGLGLAISKRLVELMRGRIWIESPNPESMENPGTIFHVRAVFEKSSDLTEDKATAGFDTLKGKRLLVFETNPQILSLMCDTLKDYKMVPVPVQSPGAIVEQIIREKKAGQSISHILLDASLPDTELRDLIGTLRHLKDFHGKIILILKPRINTNTYDFSKDPSIDAWIRKPIKRSVLLGKLADMSEKVEPEKQVDPGPDESQTPSSTLRILLVEDNKINQKVAIKMLNRMGHVALLAENGKQAIDIMDQEEKIDLILMDGQMPVMDGFQATEIIRRRETSSQNGRHIPIIALTANAMKGDRVRYIEAGMDDYIAKPVKTAELEDVIKRVMTKKKEGALVDLSHDIDKDIPEF